MKYIKRESAPEKNDAHYYSGNVFYTSGFGMPNCTTYAWGRFYELLEQLGIEGKPKLQTSNAENWYVDEKTYEKGQTPRLGAVIVWKKGQYHNPSDGAGHVGVVEEIKDDGSIVVSQSAYQGKEFYLTEHNNRYEKSGYQFDGFIYLPREFDKDGSEVMQPVEVPKEEPKQIEDDIVEYTYKQGDTFGQVIVNLGLATSHGLWGDNGDVNYYNAQLHEQGIYGNIPVGTTIKLRKRND